MHRRLLLILLSSFLFWTCLAQQPHVSRLEAASYHCHLFGQCEPCPEDALHEPFCQPFGNRQLVHCLLSDEENDRVHHGGSHPVPGEIPAWQACGRIVRQETADFWEFVLCNAFFASVALFILYTRSRTVAAQRRKALVARIGVHRPW